MELTTKDKLILKELVMNERNHMEILNRANTANVKDYIVELIIIESKL